MSGQVIHSNKGASTGNVREQSAVDSNGGATATVRVVAVLISGSWDIFLHNDFLAPTFRSGPDQVTIYEPSSMALRM